MSPPQPADASGSRRPVPTAAHWSQRQTEANRQAPELTPAVRLVDEMLNKGIAHQASDVHFEPYENYFRIRYRVDGVLHEIAQPDPALSRQLTARLKIMAGLDTAERRRPQDGRLQIRVDDEKTVDFRVNTLPTLWGEKVVLRLLDVHHLSLAIDRLGFNDHQQQQYLEALKRPQGMILVTGPTGSGKTVTLYSGLQYLNTDAVNIATVEDPVEIHLVGVNQVQVNDKVGLDFTTALHAFLRQDPDILMVGEIRHPLTAEIAIKAAQTGHKVLSTLHTNNAPETLTRLRNLGISNYNLAGSVSLIIAQRLVRKLCNACKKPQQLLDVVLREAGFSESGRAQLKLFEAQACEQCTDGYRGRIGIYEVLPITPTINQLIMTNADMDQLMRQAKAEGFMRIRQAALEKVAAGLTSLAEIERVIF